MGNATSPPSKSALSFLSTKVWRVPLDAAYDMREGGGSATVGRIGIVLFRHNAQTGEKKLVVNGKLIHRSTDLMDGGDNITFNLGGKKCRLEVVQFPGLSDHILFYDGIRIASIMDAQEILDTERPKVRVPRAHIYLEGLDERRAVFFEVVSQRSGKEEAAVQRRFSDFDQLDCLIRSAFKGHHLASSLPCLPPKSYKLLTDHFSPEFVENRRVQLEVYIRKLSMVPHVNTNPDFLEFVGIRV